MKLSVSNIAWSEEQNEEIYRTMKCCGFTGLEIAPTRIFPEQPYDKLKEANVWAEGIKKDWGFIVVSMQSIWFGRRERLFGSAEERIALLDYTKKAISFAKAVGCKNLVFGCPRNRIFSDNADPEVGIAFFKEIGNFAIEKGVVIGMEANPPIYNTNYINDTMSALKLIEKVNSDGFKLNLDIGTMIQNEESVNELRGKVSFINHVHISEPNLSPIVERQIHKQLRDLLDEEDYRGFISIEMGMTDKLQDIKNALTYVRGVFGS